MASLSRNPRNGDSVCDAKLPILSVGSTGVLFAADISPVAAAESRLDDHKKRLPIGNQCTQLCSYRRRQGTHDHWPDSTRHGTPAEAPGLYRQSVGTSLYISADDGQRYCRRLHSASLHSSFSRCFVMQVCHGPIKLQRQDRHS